MKAYINQLATAVPPHDMHKKFVQYAPGLLEDERNHKLFQRMVERSQIEHRYSFLEPAKDTGHLDALGFYDADNFPDTAARMQLYKDYAFKLVKQAMDVLSLPKVTHIITTTCKGFYAPGIDLQIIEHYGLDPAIERTAIGFMGCYAAMNALKVARHIVRSDQSAKVLIVNLELCTLHFQKPQTLESLLSFLIFADGCAASIISAEEQGLELQNFTTALLPNTQNLITWDVGNQGFDMVLSGAVPKTIADNLPNALPSIIKGKSKMDITHWAIHPGGRSILDAVETGVQLSPDALKVSRNILRQYGNMSSAAIMFVLKEMFEGQAVDQGCTMAFGPGVAVESMMFKSAGM